MKQPFDGRVKDEDREKIKKLLDLNPIVYELFDREWIEENILSHSDIDTIHPLFFRLLRDSKFPAKLIWLKEKHSRYRSFVKSLKRDKVNFNSRVSNLDLFFDLASKDNPAELEPSIPSSSKYSDIKIMINGTEYWGEVFTINASRDEYELRSLLYRIRIEYNQRNETDKCVFIILKGDYKRIDPNQLIEFLLTTAQSIRLAEGETRRIQYFQDGELLVEIDYFQKGGKISKGYYGGAMPSAEWDNSSGRIKNLVLDKVDRFQFPKKGDIRRFLYICVKDFKIDEIDLDNALLGQENVTFFSDGSHQEGRNKNGVIHDKERGPVFDQIDFVVYDIPGEGKKIYRFHEDRNIDQQAIKDNF